MTSKMKEGEIRKASRAGSTDSAEVPEYETSAAHIPQDLVIVS